MTYSYLYYRILQNVPDGGKTAKARLDLQDVLVHLRTMAASEWPEMTDQEVQDWFEKLAYFDIDYTQAQISRLTSENLRRKEHEGQFFVRDHLSDGERRETGRVGKRGVSEGATAR